MWMYFPRRFCDFDARTEHILFYTQERATTIASVPEATIENKLFYIGIKWSRFVYSIFFLPTSMSSFQCNVSAVGLIGTAGGRGDSTSVRNVFCLLHAQARFQSCPASAHSPERRGTASRITPHCRWVAEASGLALTLIPANLL